MSGPERDDLARVREQPGVTPLRERRPGPVTTPEGRPAGKPWVGAMRGPQSRDAGQTPVVQDAQRTAGTRITPGRAYGFFTDTTLCIGCKACEVACKQWNNLPADGFHFSGVSYDNTRTLSATTWRHVLFIEQFDPGRFDTVEIPTSPSAVQAGEGPTATVARAPDLAGARAEASTTPRNPGSAGAPVGGRGDRQGVEAPPEMMPQWAKPGARWLFMSDVCKHCVNAPCLEACPTGAIIRTEFDTVYVQQDVCNGCGYCVPACPFAVVEVDKHGDGKAHKCTLCYDRLKDGLEPACAKACPTDSIQFAPVDELLERARGRVGELRDRDVPAYLYGSGRMLEDRCDTGDLGGLNCFFLLIDRPEVYNLPAVGRRPSTNTAVGLLAGGLAALAFTATTMLAFASGREAA